MNKNIGKRKYSIEELLASSLKMTYREGIKQGILDGRKGIDLSRSYANNVDFLRGYKEGLSK